MLTSQLSALCVWDSESVDFIMGVIVCNREEDVLASHLHSGPLQTLSGLELVPRCNLTTAPLRPVFIYIPHRL